MTDYRTTLDPQSDDEGSMCILLDEAMDIIERRWSWRWLCGHLHRTVATDLLGDGTMDMVHEVEKLNLPQSGSTICVPTTGLPAPCLRTTEKRISTGSRAFCRDPWATGQGVVSRCRDLAAVR